ncbi:Hypothetical protein PHPALM_15649 [Phytophthora palmivora]|uniref:Uncharacterized protein n=1 Tax=Phytophthora palmivora TaxID=4796 RepID=A0A2P4XRM3_9STRA|nr:Hypothetical protein PHPALM_15649 [Phytophthora palmivora]
MSIRYQAQPVTAPRALGGDSRQVSLAQQQDRFDCETSTGCSPASPSFTSSGSLLSKPYGDAVKEATALTMQPSIINNNTNFLQRNNNRTESALKDEPRADDPAMMASSYELDHDMMNMLVNLNAGPPRAPVANWDFETASAEAQALYDPETHMSGTNNQPAPLSGLMMMTQSTNADMTHTMNMAVSVPDFIDSGLMTTSSNNNVSQDPFSGIDSSFMMPYQDVATLPVGDFPLHDGSGMYKPTFENTNVTGVTGMDQFTSTRSHVVDNQLENSVPFFGSNELAHVGPTFQDVIGSTNGNLFNDVAQPPISSMADINSGFAMPDLSMQEDDDSDWNGERSRTAGVVTDS